MGTKKIYFEVESGKLLFCADLTYSRQNKHTETGMVCTITNIDFSKVKVSILGPDKKYAPTPKYILTDYDKALILDELI